MSAYESLTLRAGPAALARIRRDGLRREDIRAVAGAAGGPKWLILPHFDRFLFGEWLDDQPVDLVGASIGTWRFAAACDGRDPAAAITRLEEAYIEQCYSTGAGREEITSVTRSILDRFLPPESTAAVAAHPSRRLTAITVRARGAGGSERRGVQALGSAVAGTANLVSRRALGLAYERVLFQNPEASDLHLAGDWIPTRRVAVSADNVRDAVYASGSIPLHMAGARDPAGAPRGVYRDGGIVDYHIDQPLVDDGLVLMPHFAENLIPGWFDKFLPWRQRPRHATNTVLIGPSRRFLARLPQGRIPDRKDFLRYAGHDAERIRDWRACAAEGERLADEFRRWLADPDPARHLAPLLA